MQKQTSIYVRRTRVPQSECSDRLVGNILSGWRYDISALSPAMRTDYDYHLTECAHCRRRQSLHRTIDVLLISVSTLSILAFLLAAMVIHRVESITHVELLHLAVTGTPITLSLEGIAIAGLVFSTMLWTLVAIATPIPGFLVDFFHQRVPQDLRNRFTRNHA